MSDSVKNPRPAGAAKHGKRHEMRLYSTSRRGAREQREQVGGINPDANINVAAVCGCEARVYDDVNTNGTRPLRYVTSFETHGAALQWAHEFEAAERLARSRRVGMR
jgi:hypothetical protein